VKRGVAEPLLNDVGLCAQMGWTHEELMRQPVRFVERLRIYLGALADREEREQRRIEEELDRMRRKRW